VNDLETIRGAGFQVEISQTRNSIKLYTIRHLK